MPPAADGSGSGPQLDPTPADVIAIETERLELRPLAEDDGDEMVGVLADPALYAFTGGEPPSLDDLRARFARLLVGRSPDGTEDWRNWTLRLIPDGEAIGTVQAAISDEGRTAIVAWVIGTPWRGNGYATEAARGLIAWLIQRGVATIEARIHSEHTASACVAANAGLARTDERVAEEEVWRLASNRSPAP
jgi:RimJ/RimL family protein N-acetyltransferase